MWEYKFQESAKMEFFGKIPPIEIMYVFMQDGPSEIAHLPKKEIREN